MGYGICTHTTCNGLLKPEENENENKTNTGLLL